MPIKAKPKGGRRPNSGRPLKAQKEKWGQITCVLRLDTIDKLRSGARSKRFGEYLQYHLDRYPLPSWNEYQALLKRQPLITEIRRRRVPVILTTGGPEPFLPSLPRRHRTEKEIEQELADSI